MTTRRPSTPRSKARVGAGDPGLIAHRVADLPRTVSLTPDVWDQYRQYLDEGITEKFFPREFVFVDPSGDLATEKEATMRDVDNVTLLQIEKGVRIYKARFFSSTGVYSFKSRDEIAPGSLAIVQMMNLPPKSVQKRAGGKYEPQYDEDEDEGVIMEPNAGPDFGIVRILNEDLEFEPRPGITYCWVVKVLDRAELEVLPKIDKEARRKLRLGAAISDAKAAVGNTDVQLLPATPAAAVPSRPPRDEEIPF